MTPRTVMSRPPRWAIAAVIGALMLAGALASMSHMDSVERRSDSVRGCLRATLDRYDNASGWRTAQAARQASALKGGPNAQIDRASAYRYARIAFSLEQRTAPTGAGRIAFCEVAYPPVSIWPWKV